MAFMVLGPGAPMAEAAGHHRRRLGSAVSFAGRPRPERENHGERDAADAQDDNPLHPDDVGPPSTYIGCGYVGDAWVSLHLGIAFSLVRCSGPVSRPRREGPEHIGW
jgi:hypothetical protein